MALGSMSSLLTEFAGFSVGGDDHGDRHQPPKTCGVGFSLAGTINRANMHICRHPPAPAQLTDPKANE